MPTRPTHFVLLTFIAVGIPSLVASQDESQIKFFENRIRPVLVEHCYECHSSEAEQREGGFTADHREGIRRGGESGAAIVPTKPDRSLILKALRYDDSFYQMPPDGKLPPEVIRDFEKWITDGAVDPRKAPADVTANSAPTAEQVLARGQDLWSLQPLKTPTVPTARVDSSWVRSPIDVFILQELQSAGMAPAPEATRREWLRRVTYDLTGLPPTPEELKSFLGDESPTAYENVVDRLLGSKRYGEKYGRHWLDVVRYADSNGLDENLAYANAFRYRDYVIRSINADVPFRDLIRQQLAGDLVAKQTPDLSNEKLNDYLIATGFLSIGPKMLACDDGKKMQMDIIDEQLDTTFRSFLGLTMGCARCHDHKFDPLLTRDYYGLAGIFKSTHTMNHFRVVAEWHEYELTSAAKEKQIKEHDASLKTVKEKLAATSKMAVESYLAKHRGLAELYLQQATLELSKDFTEYLDGTYSVGELISALKPRERTALKNVFLLEAEKFNKGDLTPEKDSYGKGIGVLLHAGYCEHEIEVAEPGQYQLELRYAALESRPVRLLIDGKLIKEQAAKEMTGGWFPQHQRWALEDSVQLSAGKHTIRIERSAAVPHIDKILLARLNPEAASRLGPSMKNGKKKTARSRLNPQLVQAWKDFLIGQRSESNSLWKIWVEQSELRADLLPAIRKGFANALGNREAGKSNASAFDHVLFESDIYGTFAKAKLKEQLTALSEMEKAEIAALQQKKSGLEKDRPKLDRAMGVRDGKIEDLKIHVRGNYLTLGGDAPRAIPAVFRSDDSKSSPPSDVFGDASSGRLQLANWITDDKNPLTARVIANRVWGWHFGKGIVRTPDNFGRLGQPPTNQPLLDWLAKELIRLDWSLKHLHREIVLSSTYRMSSRFNAAHDAADPENKTWWRFPRRRLNAEEIRDSIFAFSGRLDEAMGGQLMPDKNRGYVTGTGSKQGSYDFPRRSVYLPVLRSAVYPVLQAFDFPDPAVQSGSRQTSTIAPQALYMLNGREVLKETDYLARKLVEDQSDSVDDKIRELFLIAYSRLPSPSEVSRLRDHWERMAGNKSEDGEPSQISAETKIAAWKSVCRILVASSEFIYID